MLRAAQNCALISLILAPLPISLPKPPINHGTIVAEADIAMPQRGCPKAMSTLPQPGLKIAMTPSHRVLALPEVSMSPVGLDAFGTLVVL
jgi:hypothetical protein